jgi:methylmalonyl-CoA mutase
MKKDPKRINTLTGEFPAVSSEAWEKLIRQDLKGADYEKKLVWETIDGDRIRPYYRKEDLGGMEYLEGLPGQFPFLRGAGTTDNAWLIRQDIRVISADEANREAREILQRGATSLGFDLYTVEDPAEALVHSLLEGLPLESVPVNFKLDGHYREVLDWIHSFALKNGTDPESIRGSISLNPLGRLTAMGHYRKDLETDLSETGDCLEYVRAHLPGFRVIHNCGNILHDSGAHTTQELAFTLAMGNEYLAELTERGFPVSDIARRMQFQFSIGSSYFMEIAKLRAARYLWSRILQAYPHEEGELPPMFISSQTSRWNMTLYDPHTNLLRATSESMSAVLGGTDTLTVHPYDGLLEKTGELSRRIARNTQIILKEEAYLDKVVDPAAGSYYIENLTDTLVRGAWKLFLETEEKGGFIASLTQGFIQHAVRSSALERLSRLATRKDMLLGTNQYPLPGEKKDPTPAAGTSGNQSMDKIPGTDPGMDWIFDPLEPMRGAEEFERLRMRTERHPGKNPVVFIIPLGNLAMRRARAMFTINFFTVAGFHVMDNVGRFATVEEGTAAARKAGADIVVLCSSDEEYPGLAGTLVRESGNDLIPVIAGYPREHLESLRNDGVEHFIHLRSNLLEELTRFQELLHIDTGGDDQGSRQNQTTRKS